MRHPAMPEKQGLYDPALEHENCGTGFICNIKGKKSHEMIRDALEILDNLEHRGARGADPNVGDGAGILIQMPDEFLRAESRKIKLDLPKAGRYGVGFFFLPQNDENRDHILRETERIAGREGVKILGWRDVPTDNRLLGAASRETEPVMRQAFLVPQKEGAWTQEQFEIKLYVVRRLIERAAEASHIHDMWVPSMSSRTLVYKGMLTTGQLHKYYPDLSDKKMKSAICLVHSRYSTNTFPTWDLAQPFRFIAHNGEINTLRGNRNWMRAREANMVSEVLGDDLNKLFPIVNEYGSDSAALDNAIELLLRAGRPIEHVMTMLMPEAWSRQSHMDPKVRAFYEYHSTIMEPWDGPANVAFTDGVHIGACLDRNGLRPARYIMTRDDRVIFASEVGVLNIKPENVLKKGRLGPGKILLINTKKGTFEEDQEIKKRLADEFNYQEKIDEMRIGLEDLYEPKQVQLPDHDTIVTRQWMFGYTVEESHFILKPMANNGQEATGSMGDDTPLAVLSDKPRFLHNYFRQHFAQVTNPPIDPIREEVVMSLMNYFGKAPNLLDRDPRPGSHLIRVNQPVLTNFELEQLRQNKNKNFLALTLDSVFKRKAGEEGLAQALEQICLQADEAIKQGYSVLILSDRASDERHVPIPSLLALAAVHHHLIRQNTRSTVGLIVEGGDVREVHHFAVLLGYGASAVNPYMAFETLIDSDQQQRYNRAESTADIIPNYIKAVKKGLLKIFSKMGISTLQSYQGAQIFEAIGLNQDMVDEYFTGTPARLGGIGLREIARDCLQRHHEAFPDNGTRKVRLGNEGIYHWRNGGEFHQWNPETIGLLQDAVRNNDKSIYDRYKDVVNDQSRQLKTIRGLLEFKAKNPIPLEEVESVEEIVKRFCTGAMSIGSISRPAHETLAIAMNELGGRSNTGEGGEDPVRFRPDPDGRLRRSSIKQVASGRFGVTAHYLANSDEVQIKMAQGAKPGEGGQLPGHKVSKYIAKLRHSVPGVTLISPPPHHDIYSIEDLAQLIYDLKNANPRANISVKLVSEAGVGTVAAGVTKGHADGVLIAGHDGGTGASPITSIKHAGSPWELGLAETQQTLVLNKLRSRIRVQTDGQLKTGRDVIIGAILGADEFGFATSALIATGCIMMRKCHLNTCPVGIATQDPRLIEKYTGKAEHVVNFLTFVAMETREILAELGYRRLDDIIGRVDLLRPVESGHWKAKGLDLSDVLYMVETDTPEERYNSTTQTHNLEKVLDRQMIEDAQAAIQKKEPVKLKYNIRNSMRSVGAMLSGEIARVQGAEGLPPDTIKVRFKGSAGQSFGAFLNNGVTFLLEGEANDYVGKGMSGGTLVISPPRTGDFVAEDNLIVGNTLLYGATSGKIFIRGQAGERFCVRNSGVHAVVEGVGDHGCEYMTGGKVVVIGPTGRNFAAGMSGGIAYVLDEKGDFKQRCNMEMVGLENLVIGEEIAEVKAMIQEHYKLTKSEKAKSVLDNWDKQVKKFVKILPTEYKRILSEQAQGEAIEKDDNIEEGEEIQWVKLPVS